MNEYQVNKIKKLDPHGLNGTIQSVLLREDLATVQFSDVCYFMLSATLQEKEGLEKENKKLAQILKDYNLYTSKLLFGDNG